MLTQARGRTGVAMLLFILVAALAADQLAALPPAQGEPTTLRRLKASHAAVADRFADVTPTETVLALPLHHPAHPAM
ncbi:hypothetical protein WMF37_29450 [Sorangium sp. So ce291]|uniref:hypothetical protein n=1 Tax=Sorangium sp. So ce291 TaxID=3133294 RepID=UPI003F62FB9B